MTSFIELPRLGFRGIDQQSIYVNTRDIVTLQAEYDGFTRVEIRGYGSEGLIGSVKTYAPLLDLLDMLGTLAETPGVRSWTDETKTMWAAPIVKLLQDAADRERTAFPR